MPTFDSALPAEQIKQAQDSEIVEMLTEIADGKLWAVCDLRNKDTRYRYDFLAYEANKEYRDTCQVRASLAVAEITALREQVKVLRDVLQDALSGWRYIREVHGDLYGVGWDRVEANASAILAKVPE